jgi:hypothetical protein
LERVTAVFAAAGLPPAEALIETDVVLSWPGASPWVVVYDDQIEENICAVDGDMRLWSVSVDELVDRADELLPALREALGGTVDP